MAIVVLRPLVKLVSNAEGTQTPTTTMSGFDLDMKAEETCRIELD